MSFFRNFCVTCIRYKMSKMFKCCILSFLRRTSSSRRLVVVVVVVGTILFVTFFSPLGNPAAPGLDSVFLYTINNNFVFDNVFGMLMSITYSAF